MRFFNNCYQANLPKGAQPLQLFTKIEEISVIKEDLKCQYNPDELKYRKLTSKPQNDPVNYILYAIR
jgi:hypothetical protein